jgi:molybdopterin synthase sulfur carrier subunit
MPEVHIPPRYRGPTNGERLVEVAGRTVRECIDAVDARYPGFGELVFDANGEVRLFVTLFVNGEELDRAAVDTEVAESDRIEILAAVAGG